MTRCTPQTASIRKPTQFSSAAISARTQLATAVEPALPAVARPYPAPAFRGGCGTRGRGGFASKSWIAPGRTVNKTLNNTQPHVKPAPSHYAPVASTSKQQYVRPSKNRKLVLNGAKDAMVSSNPNEIVIEGVTFLRVGKKLVRKQGPLEALCFRSH